MALLSNVWGFDRMKLLKSVPARPEVSKGRAEVPKPVGGRARALRYLGERMGGERLFFQTCRGFDPMKLLPVRPESRASRTVAIHSNCRARGNCLPILNINARLWWRMLPVPWRLMCSSRALPRRLSSSSSRPAHASMSASPSSLCLTRSEGGGKQSCGNAVASCTGQYAAHAQ